jgi:hypothetical protein
MSNINKICTNKTDLLNFKSKIKPPENKRCAYHEIIFYVITIDDYIPNNLLNLLKVLE